ncbi:minor capsid protein [Erythrobacteraceae bacterium WH01K]|nr:minor capsid protein [Erythrobacteraceae bacterium WH01K]
MSVNEDLQDRAIRHALALQRYSKGLSDRIVRLLNSADKELIEKLAARLAAIDERGIDNGPKTTKRIKEMLSEISAINSAIFASIHDTLEGELTDFADAEARGQQKALEKAIVVNVATKLPSPRRIAAIASQTPIQGILLKPWVEGMGKARIERIEQQVRLGLLEGEGTDAIVRRIRGTRAAKYRDGILDKSRRSTQALVRTATTQVSNVAMQETWKANSNLIKGWEFMATLDSRTTVTCAGLSGQVFPIGEGPMPPRHVNCRSISVPVTKSFRELGLDRDELTPAQRASMDGQVPGDTTFKDWLERKGEATQNEVLGPERAAIFRSGKLNLDQFIKNDGSVLTLDELKRLYPSLG